MRFCVAAWNYYTIIYQYAKKFTATVSNKSTNWGYYTYFTRRGCTSCVYRQYELCHNINRFDRKSRREIRRRGAHNTLANDWKRAYLRLFTYIHMPFKNIMKLVKGVKKIIISSRKTSTDKKKNQKLSMTDRRRLFNSRLS